MNNYVNGKKFSILGENNMIRVSVCIATYNGEKYIEEQINSILKQLSKNDEIIISDDYSTDNTINIIKVNSKGQL